MNDVQNLAPIDLKHGSWQSVPKAASICGVTKQAVYDRISRGTCIARIFCGLTVVEIEDLKWRTSKRS